MMVREAEARGVHWSQTVRARDLRSAVQAPVITSSVIHSADPKQIHEMYLQHIGKLKFSKVLIEHDLMHEYLTKESPERCMISGPHEHFTKDDRLVMRRFALYTKLPSNIVLFQPTWKFYHELGLQLADELKLGPTDIKWLILNQNAFRLEGLTKLQFIQRARLWHDMRVMADGFDNSVLFEVFLSYYQGFWELSQAVRDQCLENDTVRDMHMDDIGQPDNQEALQELLETFSSMQLARRNYHLLYAQRRATEFDALAVQVSGQQDPTFQTIRYRMESRGIKPFGDFKEKFAALGL
jgi:hypothetical protein